MGKRIDLTGQHFGYWTVLNYSHSKDGQTYWNCRCKCGTEKAIRGYCLRNNKSKSCGCASMEKGLHLLNQRFSHLIVEKQLPSKNWKTYWLCKCDCGSYCKKYGSDLISGKATNCGCISKKNLSDAGKKRWHDLTGQKVGLLTIIKRIEDKIYNNKSYVNYLCKCECGKEVEITGAALSAGQISCGCLRRSRGEYQIFQTLNNLKCNFQEQYKITLKNRTNRFFDFAIIKNNTLIGLIEFDGQQHYEEVSIFNKTLEENQLRDSQKNQWAMENNIPLLRISYKNYKNIFFIIDNFLKEIKYYE